LADFCVELPGRLSERGRFLGIKERQTGRKCLKTAWKKTATRFFYFCKANFDLLLCRACSKIVKVKLLAVNLRAAVV
jgi:hypothetical protein